MLNIYLLHGLLPKFFLLRGDILSTRAFQLRLFHLCIRKNYEFKQISSVLFKTSFVKQVCFY